ncbi:MAG TPA: 2-amino-4-hydroxy-6-hydroxymethyldihydropteridine diphosphokinase [Nitrospirota bacterium]|nr:2-amino-4-hydroxy-6-hydroxymethyldihydropteridine diphosphokinase [Nitrospirota bacterium]
MPKTVYIGLGSNLGDKVESCRKAIAMLSKAGNITSVSSFYTSEPIGYPDQEEFINAAVELETELSPLALLAACHVIEDELGRRRLMHWGPRTVDLDILFYGNLVVESDELVIPHPLMAERRFVLVPLCEIAPDAVHPVLHKKVSELLRRLKDNHRVAPYRAGERQ